MRVEAGREGFLAVAFLSVAGEGEEPARVSGSPGLASNFVAGEAGQANIDDGDLGSPREDQFEPARTVGRGPYRVAFELEHGAQPFENVFIVFDDGNTTLARFASSALFP